MSFKDFKSMYYSNNYNFSYTEYFPMYKRTYIIFNSLIDNYKYQYWALLRKEQIYHEQEYQQAIETVNRCL